ncbi:MAG: tetratricopeptide repeat protein [Acidobacteria bacterium]|nr:tetratricopeptide repeat protein [Acidobacteriota bacterium]MCI0724967.1 tetratricopeptide repeat protein [Acidobacteriota bacterium]
MVLTHMERRKGKGERRKGVKATLLLMAGLMGTESLAGSNSPAEDLRQAQQLIQRGDLSAAHDRLTQALKQFPNEFNLYNFLGVVEAQQGNYLAAESSFQKAIALAPRVVGAYLNLGRLYQENGVNDPKALQKGLDAYQRLLRFQPDNAEANYQSAVLLQRFERFKESLQHLSRLPAEAQRRAQVLALRLAGEVRLGEETEVEQRLRELTSASDLQESDVLAILSVLGAQGSPDLRQKLLESLSSRGLASSVTLRQLGLLYEERHQLDLARQTLEKSATSSSALSALLIDLARVAHKQRDHLGALGYLAHARDLDPKDAGIHFFFGMVCIDAELPLEAQKSLQEAVRLQPDRAYYQYALGSVLLQGRDPSLAIPPFQQYCQLKPEDVRGRFSLGTAHFYSNDFKQARQELQAVAGRPETAAGAHYFLARVAKQEDNLLEALEHLHQSLKANPNYAESHAELGLIYLRNKEYERAEKALRTALELDPESYRANLNLLNLFQRTKDPRAQEQALRFEAIQKKKSERQQTLLRPIEVRPY